MLEYRSMDQTHALSPLGPPIEARSHQVLHNRRRSSTLAGLVIDELRQTKTCRKFAVIGSTSMQPNQRHVSKMPRAPNRFLSLPAELRNRIYELLFESEIPLIKPTYTLPGLLVSCKKIYAEAIGLYYSTTPAFRCLDEASAVSWLTALPKQCLDLVKEVQYDTRWIVFVTPLIPVPGVECWLFQNLLNKLQQRHLDVDGSGLLRDREAGVGGKLKVSFYRKGAEGNGIVWTDKPGLIGPVSEGGR